LKIQENAIEFAIELLYTVDASGCEDVMGLGLTKLWQAKIPVTDVPRSTRWYQALLDLELLAEFVEQDVLRGAALIDRDDGYVIALRDREVSASRPDLSGFDLFGFRVASPRELHQIMERCDRLGVDHGDIEDRGISLLGIDVPDPDGTVLRFLCFADGIPGGFTGVEVGDDGETSYYDTPRIRIS
jgi:catechol 2,3-dioxygenase-like lactoylglutathione lyase family enzyme